MAKFEIRPATCPVLLGGRGAAWRECGDPITHILVDRRGARRGFYCETHAEEMAEEPRG